MISLNISCIFITFFILITKVKNKWAVGVLTALFTIFVVLEVVSYYFFFEWIGYEFISATDPSLIRAFIGDFHTELFVFSAMYVLLTISLIFIVFSVDRILTRFTNHYKHTHILKNKIVQIVLLVLSVLFLSSGDNMFSKIYNEITVFNFSKKEDYHAYLPDDFTDKSDVFAKPGKNIIVIMTESLEANFLDARYGNYTPKLNALIDSHQYLPVKQNAAGNTAGSVYALFTSLQDKIPYRTDEWYHRFHNIVDFHIPTLGAILKKAGYEMRFSMGLPNANGKNFLLNSNHFQIVSPEKGKHKGDFLSKYDYDNFAEAKNQIKELASSKKPFAFFLLTYDAHINNKPNLKMEKYLNKKLSDYEDKHYFILESTDYLIGDLIDFVDKEGLLSDTVFYIFPDHKLHGRGAHIDKSTAIGDRNLFLITNAETKLDTYGVSIQQTQLPRVIINGAQITTNAKFLSDYPDTPTDRETSKKINESIIIRRDYQKEYEFSITNNTVVIHLDGEVFKEVDITDDPKSINIIFSREGFKFLELQSSKNNFTPYRHVRQQKPIQLTIFLANKNIQTVYLGNYIDVGLWYEPEDDKVIIPKEDISKTVEMNEQSFKHELYDQEWARHKKLLNNPDWFTITSSSRYYQRWGVKTEAKLGKRKFEFGRGLNVLYLDKNNDVAIKNYDTKESQLIAYNFTDFLKELKSNNKQFIVFSHHTVGYDWGKGGDFKSRLIALSLDLFADFNSGWGHLNSYIAYYDGEKIQEVNDAFSVTMTLPVFSDYKPTKR